MNRKHLGQFLLTPVLSLTLAGTVNAQQTGATRRLAERRSATIRETSVSASPIAARFLLPHNIERLLFHEEEEDNGFQGALFLGPLGVGIHAIADANTLGVGGGFGDEDLPDPSELQTEPWVGEVGVTETVAEIMAREHFFRRGKGLIMREEREGPDRTQLPQNPDSPAVAQWPPADENATPPDAGRGRFNPQTVSTSFTGSQLSLSGFVPPDSIGSVSPTQVGVCTNGLIRVFDKNGVLGGLNATDINFFNSVRNSQGISDPRIRFDPTSQRWFIIAINTAGSNNRVLIAVSSGPTITNTSSFTFFFFQQNLVNPAGNTNAFADYPTLGVDANALYIGANMFGSSFSGTGWVVRKSSILGVGPIVATAFRNIGTANTGIYTPQGVNNDDPTATQGYFIGADAGFFGSLVLRRVSDPGGSPTISAGISLTVPATTFPQPQPALGSTSALDEIDDRLYAAEIRKNRLTGLSTLWTAHNIEVNASGVASASGNRNGSRWYEIQNLSGTPTLRQSGTLFDSAGTNPVGFWIPSVTMSGQGHMAIGVSAAGAARRAEIVVAGRLSSDTLGVTQTPTTAQTSSTSYNIGLQSGNYRWGDYSLTCVDPADDMTIWTFQEWCNGNNSWAVRAIKLLAPPPATPTSLSPNTVNRGATNVNVVVTGTSSGGSGFFDPGAGFSGRLQASVSGTGVTVNSVTFTNPTSITLNLTVTSGATLSTRTITVTNPDGQAVTSGALLTVQAGTVAVSGTITLEDCANPAQPIDFEFRPQPSGTTLNRSTTLSGTGAYTFNDIPPGNYIVSIKGDKWLRKNIAVNAAGNVMNANATLKTGDANDDNSADVLDLDILIQTFDKCLGDGGYNAATDFNCDNCVDVLDLDLLLRNFDVGGDL